MGSRTPRGSPLTPSFRSAPEGRERLVEIVGIAVAQAVHEIAAAHRSVATALHDFLEEPAKVRDGLIAIGKDPDGVLHRHGADPLQSAPHLTRKYSGFGGIWWNRRSQCPRAA